MSKEESAIREVYRPGDLIVLREAMWINCLVRDGEGWKVHIGVELGIELKDDVCLNGEAYFVVPMWGA